MRILIYESFVRPHLDYGNIIYDQPNNSTLSNKIESIQYNAVLAITNPISGTCRDKLYQGLCLESLQNGRWLRWLCYFQKILSTKLPPYLCNLTPPLQRSHRNPGCLKALQCRAELFQNSFLPYSVNNWNKLDPSIRCAESHSMYQKEEFQLE